MNEAEQDLQTSEDPIVFFLQMIFIFQTEMYL